MLVVGDILFTSSMDLSIKCWSLPDLILKNTLTGHEEPVKKMAYNGTNLLAGDYNGVVWIYIFIFTY